MQQRDRDDLEERNLGHRVAGQREVSMRDWMSLRGERGEKYGDPKAFKRLLDALRQRRYWAQLDPLTKGRIKAYRAAWNRANRNRVNASVRKHRAAHGRSAGEIASRLRKRAAEKRERHAACVHTCEVCGAQWCSPLYMELPKRPVVVCGIRCRNRRTVAYRKTFGLCIHCGKPAREGRVSCARHASSASRRKKAA